MAYNYYLKKCQFQELGSVGSDGIVHRGRYLLTSKNERILSLFPPLSISQLNDSALLTILPLYSGKKVYANYIYHNDKFHGSTAAHPRNEYRIYLNKELEEDSYLFEKNDIIIIRKQTVLSSNTDEIDSFEETVYLLDLVKPNNTLLYSKYDSYINSYSEIKGGYACYNGYLKSFEAKAEVVLANLKTAEIKIDDSVTQRIEDSSNPIAGLFSASTFHDFVMTGYDYKDAITGEVIKYKGYNNLEAAHIKPRSHGGLYLPNNGLALTRDHHWAFDKGFFTLDDSFNVMVHPEVDSDYLRQFDHKKIRLPENTFFVPDIENIKYHREHVYGLFLTSGRL